MKYTNFRGKNIDNTWIYSKTISEYSDNFCLLQGENNLVFVYKTTICQSTGLFDKNGVEIFEGDIVDISDAHCNGFNDVEIVKYKQGGFYPFSVAGWECEPDANESVVIGNIFDDPNIKKEKCANYYNISKKFNNIVDKSEEINHLNAFKKNWTECANHIVYATHAG